MTDFTDIPVECVCGTTFYIHSGVRNPSLLRCPKCRGRIKSLRQLSKCNDEIDFGDASHNGKRCEPMGHAIDR